MCVDYDDLKIERIEQKLDAREAQQVKKRRELRHEVCHECRVKHLLCP